MACAPVPSNVTVPPDTKFAAVAFVQSPAIVTEVPDVNVPFVKVKDPFISRVVGAVKLPVVWVRLLTISVLAVVLRVWPAVLLTITLLKV